MMEREHDATLQVCGIGADAKGKVYYRHRQAQQAARVSDYTAFCMMAEFGPTQQIFATPQNKQPEDYLTGRFG